MAYYDPKTYKSYTADQIGMDPNDTNPSYFLKNADGSFGGNLGYLVQGDATTDFLKKYGVNNDPAGQGVNAIQNYAKQYNLTAEDFYKGLQSRGGFTDSDGWMASPDLLNKGGLSTADAFLNNPYMQSKGVAPFTFDANAANQQNAIQNARHEEYQRQYDAGSKFQLGDVLTGMGAVLGVGALANGGLLGSLGGSGSGAGWTSGFDLPMGGDLLGGAGNVGNAVTSIPATGGGSGGIGDVFNFDDFMNSIGSGGGGADWTGQAGNVLDGFTGNPSLVNDALSGADQAAQWEAQALQNAGITPPVGGGPGGNVFSPSMLSNVPTSVLSRFLNGTATAADKTTLAGLLGTGALSAMSANKYADAMKAIDDRSWSAGEPYRGRLEATYTNPGAHLDSPEVKAVTDRATNALARSLSARDGNPVGSGRALTEIQDYGAQTMLGQLNQQRNMLAGFGGLPTIAGNALGAATQSAEAGGNMFNSLANTVSRVTQPQTNWQDIFRMYGGANGLA